MATKFPKVALVKGDDRYDSVSRALELLADDIDLSSVNNILIKPNLISVTRQQIATTHIDAVRATLDFLRQRTSAQVIIAEGTGDLSAASTDIGFKNFGYQELAEQYNMPLIDLNYDEAVETQIFDWQLKPLTIRLAKTAVEADYRISICPPKTHDCVIITASLKNMVMGSILRSRESWVEAKLSAIFSRLLGRIPAKEPAEAGKTVVKHARRTANDKIKVHQGYAAMNLNLYKLAQVVPPHLAIIDGCFGMEGAGPVDGEEVPFGIAIASIDSIAADSLAALLMGFEPQDIGYLFYCWQRGMGELEASKMNLLGEKVENCIRPFKPHPLYEAQLRWHIPDVEGYLA
jgi:uncharacterized protein (DUF362 family)